MTWLVALTFAAGLALGFGAGWLAKRSWLVRQLEATEQERRDWRALAERLSEKNERLSGFADAVLRAELERGDS